MPEVNIGQFFIDHADIVFKWSVTFFAFCMLGKLVIKVTKKVKMTIPACISIVFSTLAIGISILIYCDKCQVLNPYIIFPVVIVIMITIITYCLAYIFKSGSRLDGAEQVAGPAGRSSPPPRRWD